MIKKKLMFTFLLCTFFLNIPNEAVSKKCDLQLREGQIVSDLNRLLECLESRITDLEAKNFDLEKKISSGGKTLNPEVFRSVLFDVSILGCSLNHDEINISLSIRNKTSKTIFLAIDTGRSPVLMDQLTGKVFEWSSNNKMGTTRSNEGGRKNQENYTPILANNFFYLGLGFDSEGLNEKSSKAIPFVLSLTLYHLENKKMNRITVPLTMMLN